MSMSKYFVESFIWRLGMATFDLTSKNFEKSDADFHMNWFSDENIGVMKRFQRLCSLFSFLRTASCN